jgi:hypothetical protein
VLTLGKEPLSSDVELSWEGGFGPFSVRRSDSPEPAATWVDLTPPEGTNGFSWVDSDAVLNGRDHYYLIQNQP